MILFLLFGNIIGTARRLAKEGYGIYGMDYEGHGKSSGLQGFVSSFDNVVEDCSTFFTSITGQQFLSSL